MADASSTLHFELNGVKRTEASVEPRTTLLDYLRGRGLTGTKESCRQGGCGACVVSVSRYDPLSKTTRNYAINSCLAPLASLDGASITTVEGLGSSKGGLHPIQECIAKGNGSQCGYCTPGMVMALYSKVRETGGRATKAQIEKGLDGNICRCTGFRPILQAAHQFASDAGDARHAWSKAYKDAASEPTETRALEFVGRDSMWFKPLDLAQVLSMRKEHHGKTVKLVVGNTTTGILGVDRSTDVYLDISAIPELNQISCDGKGPLTVGAAVTITRLIATLEEHTKHSQCYHVLARHMNKIANTNVRNAGSWAGNVMLARSTGFPSDMTTILIGARAVLNTVDNDGNQHSTDVLSFLHSKDDHVIVSVALPKYGPTEQLHTYRSAARPANAHAYINCAFYTNMGKDGVVQDCSLVFGVVAHYAVRASATEAILKGKPVNQATLNEVLASIDHEIVPEPERQYMTADYPEGKEGYRKALIRNFLYKLFVRLGADLKSAPPAAIASAVLPHGRGSSTGKPVFEARDGHDAITKIGAELQATGEAQYTDDLPRSSRDLFGVLVVSKKACCTALVDINGARLVEGFVDFVNAADVPGLNEVGIAPGEEPLFGTDKIPNVGQPLGLMVAETREAAERAASMVNILYGKQYEEPIVSLDDAVAKKSFIAGAEHNINSGDVEAAFASSEHVVEGDVRVGGQIPNFMERCSAYAVPGEGDHSTVYIGMQAPDYTRIKVAACLGVAGNQVTIVSRRVGGGFGGKLTRHLYLTCAAAVASKKLQAPVRVVATIQQDFGCVGGRHAIKSHYKVGFNRNGQINGVHFQSFLNGGSSTDFTGILCMEFNDALDSVYAIPNFKGTAIGCKTHIPSRTAVRSFGHSQAIYITETMIEHIASVCRMTPEAVRDVNLYTDRNCITPLGQYLDGCNIREIIAKTRANADFEAREAAVNAFNAAHKWRKRGISMVGMKYGLSQAYSMGTQALVNINGSDGTVLVYHGGCEIGQGMHTKVSQVVALTLGCPLSKVRVGDTNTDVAPNAGWTGGSTGSEANAEAARLACVELNQRLLPVKNKLWEKAEGTAPAWEALIAAANARQVLLSATGRFIPIGKETSETRAPFVPFHAEYFSFGAACSEVEVDILTGEAAVIRSDVVYDAGNSLNPLLDAGQAEGAFVMGIGYFVKEEVLVLPDGTCASDSTWEYKPPVYTDIPSDFRVELMKDKSFHRGVLGSRGIAEPPMLLAYTVAGGIRAAIRASRAERGLGEHVNVDAPLTNDRVERACSVQKNHLVMA